jgi:hypothetical protein
MRQLNAIVCRVKVLLSAECAEAYYASTAVRCGATIPAA